MLKHHKRTGFCLAMAAGLAFCAQGATISSTWDSGGDGTSWGNADNWNPAQVPDNDVTNDYEVSFNGALNPPTGTVSLGANRTISTLSINTGGTTDININDGTYGLTITGGNITVAGNWDAQGGLATAVDLTVPTEINVTNGSGSKHFRIDGTVTCSDKITFTGTGVSELGADNSGTLTGDIEITDGNVRTSNYNAFGNTTNQTLTIRNGASLSMAGTGTSVLSVDKIQLDAGASIGVRAGDIGSDITGGGSITDGGGLNGLIISGDSSGFTGDVTITSGDLLINGTIGTTDITFDDSDDTFGGTGKIIFTVDASGTYDTMTVDSGEFDISGLTLDFNILGGLEKETVLADLDGASTLTGASFSSVLNIPNGGVIEYGGTALNPGSIVLVIPEPATFGLLLAAAAAVGLRRSRSR